MFQQNIIMKKTQLLNIWEDQFRTGSGTGWQFMTIKTTTMTDNERLHCYGKQQCTIATHFTPLFLLLPSTPTSLQPKKFRRKKRTRLSFFCFRCWNVFYLLHQHIFVVVLVVSFSVEVEVAAHKTKHNIIKNIMKDKKWRHFTTVSSSFPLQTFPVCDHNDNGDCEAEFFY